VLDDDLLGLALAVLARGGGDGQTAGFGGLEPRGFARVVRLGHGGLVAAATREGEEGREEKTGPSHGFRQ